MFLNGVLNRREREIIERDTYNRSEFSGDYYDEYAYGSDLVDEFGIEGSITDDTYCIKDFSNGRK